MTATASGRAVSHTLPFILFDEFAPKRNPERQGQGPGSVSKGAFQSKSSMSPLEPCTAADNVGFVVAIPPTLARFKSHLMSCWFTIQTPASHRMAAHSSAVHQQEPARVRRRPSDICSVLGRTGTRLLRVLGRTGHQRR